MIMIKEWVLFNPSSAICQLYHGENNLIYNEMMMRSALYYINMLSWIFIKLGHGNNSPQIDMSPPLGNIILIPSQPVFLFLLNVACLAEKQRIPISKSIIWLEPTIYHTRGEHTNHYANNVVCMI